jgi:hypothetical protein
MFLVKENIMHNFCFRRLILVSVILSCIAAVTLLSSCYGSQSGPLSYDSGANNLTLAGPQIIQYNLFRFDTSAAERTLTFPSAADIVSALSVPAGSFTACVVTADGEQAVKIVGGNGVTVKPSSSSIPGNTTKTLYIVLKSVSSGSQSVDVY